MTMTKRWLSSKHTGRFLLKGLLNERHHPTPLPEWVQSTACLLRRCLGLPWGESVWVFFAFPLLLFSLCAWHRVRLNFTNGVERQASRCSGRASAGPEAAAAVTACPPPCLVWVGQGAEIKAVGGTGTVLRPWKCPCRGYIKAESRLVSSSGRTGLSHCVEGPSEIGRICSLIKRLQ